MIWLWWVLEGWCWSLLKSPKLRRLQVSSHHCNFESGLPRDKSGLCPGESMKVNPQQT